MEALTGMGDVRKHTNLRLAEIDDIPKHEAVNRHTASSRIGLGDSTSTLYRHPYRHHTVRLYRWHGIALTIDNQQLTAFKFRIDG
jgi:hypothetical protein